MSQYHTMQFIAVPGQPMLVYRMKCSNAKQNVTLARADVDALNGKPGSAVECMNAQCSIRLQAKFPHPFFFAEFTTSRAFVVDKMKGGVPLHCVRYILRAEDAKEIKLFDSPGGKAKMRRLGLVEKELTLLAPSTSYKGSHSVGNNARRFTGEQHTGTTKATPVPRNSWARAARAGLLTVGSCEVPAGSV